MDPAARALGRKIAFHRTGRGLTQRDFGALISRSETWVGQIERGERHIDRMTVLRQVAEALAIPVSELMTDTPVIVEATSRTVAAQELRMLLSSSFALSMAIGERTAQAPLSTLEEGVSQAWDLVHGTAYSDLVPLLTELIPMLETAVRVGPHQERRESWRLLARTYHAVAAALAKLGELAAAWVAADRAISAAEQADDLHLMAEGAFRLVVVFQGTRQYDQAEHAALSAINAMRSIAAEGDPATISLLGILQLQLAIIAARQNDAESASQHLREARQAADELGQDRNDFNTEFGPTNVRLHEVAVAVELGDAGTAIRLATGVMPSELSPERRGRFLIDVARAHLQRRKRDDAESCIKSLLEAEAVAPEAIRGNDVVQRLLQDINRWTGGRDARVRGLIERAHVA
jgi:transcriptional regulator with XRE-family HTH domain